MSQRLSQLVRRRWRLLLVIALLFIVLLAICNFAYANWIVPHGVFVASDQAGNNNNNTGPVSHSFQVGTQPSIVIKGHTSDVDIHAGDGGTVTVTARKHGSALGPDANDTHILYKQSQDSQGHDHITIAADPAFKDIDYDVAVPSSALVQVEVDSGSISATGISGATIDTGSGSLDVENIQGPINISTESGDITARAIKGQTTMEAGSGSIRANGVNGQLNATTRSGDVVVRAATLNGQSVLKTNSGSVVLEGTLDPRGTYQMTTNSGNINLTLPNNAAFQLIASTGSGSVNNEFGSDTVGTTPRAQVTATIGSGSVTVNKQA